jgi:hypothetical protein
MIQEQEAHFPSPSFKHVIMAPGELEQARWVNDFSPHLIDNSDILYLNLSSIFTCMEQVKKPTLCNVL